MLELMLLVELAVIDNSFDNTQPKQQNDLDLLLVSVLAVVLVALLVAVAVVVVDAVHN